MWILNFNTMKKLILFISIFSLLACSQNQVDEPVVQDDFIAPKKGCEKFLNAFQNKENKLLFYSKENGNLENYNHSRILKSQSSKEEIWPIVENWITNKKLLPTPPKLH